MSEATASAKPLRGSVAEASHELKAYLLRILPAGATMMLAVAVTPALLAPNAHKAVTIIRLVLFILSFVLVRDAMTGAGLWSIGIPQETNGPRLALQLQLHHNSHVLLFLAVTSVLIVLLMNAVEPALAAQLQGRAVLRGGFMAWARSVMIGGSASLVIAAPQAVMESRTPQETQPPSQRRYYICLLAMCLCGNLLEEVLFRGYLQGWVQREGGATGVQAAWLAGLAFCVLHSFLASTVTNLGFPVLAFTLWEGCFAAFLAYDVGLVAAVLAHGLAIFWLSSQASVHFPQKFFAAIGVGGAVIGIWCMGLL